jgi:hypothetical protein
MNGQQLYDKAAQLLDRAYGENDLMRGIYEDLARSYFRMASGWIAAFLSKAEKSSRTQLLIKCSLNCWQC